MSPTFDFRKRFTLGFCIFLNNGFKGPDILDLCKMRWLKPLEYGRLLQTKAINEIKRRKGAAFDGPPAEIFRIARAIIAELSFLRIDIAWESYISVD